MLLALTTFTLTAQDKVKKEDVINSQMTIIRFDFIAPGIHLERQFKKNENSFFVGLSSDLIYGIKYYDVGFFIGNAFIPKFEMGFRNYRKNKNLEGFYKGVKIQGNYLLNLKRPLPPNNDITKWYMKAAFAGIVGFQKRFDNYSINIETGAGLGRVYYLLPDNITQFDYIYEDRSKFVILNKISFGIRL